MVADTALAGTPVAVTISIDVPVRMWEGPTRVCNRGAGPYDVTETNPNEETEDQPTSLLFLDVKP